jgi:hypothetical protein
MEDNNRHDTDEQTTGGSKMKAWIEENLRLVVSVIIVLAIAGGIYSYSQRGQENHIALDDDWTQEQIILEDDDVEANEEAEEEIVSSDQTETPSETQEEDMQQEETQEETNVEAPQPQPVEETTEGFMVTATKGEGLTHLARRAVADYLAQNPDSELSAAHKIYIEDYVRKASSHTDGVFVGTQVSFSKTVIDQAIDASKSLTDAQLDNLQHYVALTPSLS